MDHDQLCAWLWSEDFATKVCLPIDLIKAYLPIQATHSDFLAATASSNLVILLDGVGGELLSKIDDYIRHFPRADTDDTRKKFYVKEFVRNMDEEMLAMMLTEVAKRNSTALEMVLLHSAIKKKADAIMSHWKHKLAKKYIPNMK